MNRFLYPSAFTYVLPNGEVVTRDWQVYSPSKTTVFCFQCILFSSDRSIKLGTLGDNDWNNINQTLKVYETNAKHIDSITTLADRSCAAGGIEEKLHKTMCEQRNYWKNVLSVVLQQLPFFVKEVYHCGEAVRLLALETMVIIWKC